MTKNIPLLLQANVLNVDIVLPVADLTIGTTTHHLIGGGLILVVLLALLESTNDPTV